MALADSTRAGVDDELREAMLTGRLVDWRTGDTTADDPADGAGWAASRTVAAALVADLLTDAKGPRRPLALRLAGARITGALNLESAELTCPLLLHGCWLDKPINLTGAKIPTLVLSGCRVPGLNGKQLQTQGDLSIEGTVVDGEVVITGARVGGNLDLSGATIANQGGGALLADALNIQENLLGDGFKAFGEVDLDGASINGFADFKGASVDNLNGPALHAEALSIGRSLTLWEGFSAYGEVSLLRPASADHWISPVPT